MTTPPVLIGQFGQTLAFAERALSAKSQPADNSH